MEETKEVLLALEHVRLFHPEVCIVIFSKDGRWLYMDQDFNIPIFSDSIDIAILEAAADSLNYLPYICQL